MLGAGAAYILNPDVLGVSFVDAHFVGEHVRLHSRICAFACVNIGECKLAWREALGSNAYYRLLISKVFFQSCALLGDGTVVCWFGDQDFLPRRYESKGGLIGDMTMTIDYKPVTITAPEGAKPISSLMSGLQ